ncbi:hypothetical protein NDU88_005476 [Pleurodeles waltl]|uniref:Uncharacterized protein n=1 Tax=Pleurodeles waltl TaxID=8319 RepID=A0AAV7PNR0_PLEWA|nr:hypothetical protein NDU88_005476 [Pleurodeles waltl]
MCDMSASSAPPPGLARPQVRAYCRKGFWDVESLPTCTQPELRGSNRASMVTEHDPELRKPLCSEKNDVLLKKDAAKLPNYLEPKCRFKFASACYLGEEPEP